MVDGREVTLNIWDSPYSEVRINLYSNDHWWNKFSATSKSFSCTKTCICSRIQCISAAGELTELISQHSTTEASLFAKKVQWADGYVLVYSICDRASFNTVSKLIQTIRSTKDFLNRDKAPIVIVGNKRDLHHRRTVPSEEGRLLALNTNCHFYEVSAAENYHSVLMVFHGLVDRMKDIKLTTKRPLGFKGIVKSMSAVFARRRTDSF